MKALNKMDNLDKGQLLISLLPEELENMLQCIEMQCDYFLQNEIKFREGWNKNGFFSAEFWYRLVREAKNAISNNQQKLSKHPRWFADQFFNGYNTLFTIYCLIDYTDIDQCSIQLKQTVHLLFGSEKLLQITLNERI